MNNRQLASQTISGDGWPAVEWSPVLAGTIVALGSEVLLNFLGLGFGLTNLTSDPQKISIIGNGAMIWLSFSGVLTMFYGGWVSGLMLKSSNRLLIALHGLVAWSLATLLAVSVSSSALGVVIGGPQNMIKASMQEVGQQTIQANGDPASQSATAGGNSSASDAANENSVTEGATNAAGNASFSLFIAFLLSALAGAGGAIVGHNKKVAKAYPAANH